MMSRKFSKISDNQIASFLNKSDNQKVENDLLDYVETVSDLWALANINETYYEENKKHCSIAAFGSGEYPPD